MTRAQVHYLKHNEGMEFPNCVICVDTETWISKTTTGRSHALRLGAAIIMQRDSRVKLIDDRTGDMTPSLEYSRSALDFDNISEFWECLDKATNRNSKVHVMAHNAAYDMAVLDIYGYFSGRGYTIDFWAITGAYIISATKRWETDGKPQSRTIVVVDTMNYFNTSLSKLGKAVGLPKLNTRWGNDFEGEIYLAAPDSEVLAYCKRDVEVISLAFEKFASFVNEHDLGHFSLTAAGQAWHAFRHRFMKENKILVHDFPGIRKLERESYRGGRTEAFYLGTADRLYKLDINSMYPSVMLGKQYPIAPMSQTPVSAALEDLIEAMYSDVQYIARVTVDMKRSALGIKMNGKLLFPVGRFEAVLTSVEVNHVLTHPEDGTVISCSEAIFYRSAELFTEYVEYFYDMRKTSKDPTDKAFLKIFLNALYGKFAQRSFEKIALADEAEKKFVIEAMDRFESNHFKDLATGYNFIRIGGILYKSIKKDEYIGNIAPAISSFVTAYARMHLWKLISKCPPRSCLYTDTDSVFVTEAGLAVLNQYIDPSELGMLKEESYGKADIRGVKLYDWESWDELDTFCGCTFREYSTTSTMKGVRKAAEKVGENTYRQSEWQTRMSRFNTRPAPGEVLIEDRVKHISGNYEKGVVQEDGWVKPYEFELDKVVNDN